MHQLKTKLHVRTITDIIILMFYIPYWLIKDKSELDSYKDILTITFYFAVAFRLYDLRQTGFIEQEEVTSVVSCVHVQNPSDECIIFDKILC